MIRTIESSIPAERDSETRALLRCPCGHDVSGLQCLHCGFRLAEYDGIVCALPQARVAYYARFAEEYRRIRIAEGRSSQGDAFYLGLPYIDLTGTNSRQWKIRKRSFDCLLSILRDRFPAERGVQVLDIGAGNCWMSYRLALAGYRPAAVDLAVDALDGLGAAEHYRSSVPMLFPRFQAEMDHLPFQNAQFDVAVFNASFHYSQNYEKTLREALRCLRQGGLVAIVDSPWYSSDESGRQMVGERRTAFLRKYGTASDAIEHLEYLTGERLRELEITFGIHWEIHSPQYGLRWATRPVIARLQRRREPSTFQIYIARKEK